MCGVAGLFALERTPLPATAELDVAAMLHALAHRGPDGSGIAGDGPALLGHRRLAIIDLEGGAQPIGDGDGQVLLTFNGEIYNYRELRAELVGRGRRFATASDSEVLAAAVAEWGADCLGRLRGMFAFAAWDRRRRRLLVARDRVGKKPLYYARVGDLIALASELPALLAWRMAPRALDPASVAEYLRSGYVAAPRSIVAHVCKLPAASYLDLAADGAADLTARTYWRPHYEPKTRGGRAAEDELDGLLDDAVRDRLIADVPVGAFLSGGLDSATVVMRAAAQRAGLRTFTVGFDDDSADERRAARAIARRAGTEHHEALVALDAASQLPRIAAQLGEPLGDSSALPTFLIAEIARPHVKVVLTGDGGDEIFAGYNRYARSRLSLLYALLPPAIRRAAGIALLALGAPRARIAELEERARRSPAAVYSDSMTVIDPRDAAALVHADHRAAALAQMRVDHLERVHDRTPASHWLDRLLHTDLASYLADDVLVKMDRMTMAHGIEARSPLLDHRIIEFAARLPTSEKRRPSQPGKRILRRLAARTLPPEILALPKRGFDVPFGRRIAGGSLRDAITAALTDASLVADGWLDGVALRRELAPGRDGAAPLGNRLWSLYILELWYRSVIRGSQARSAVAGVA